MTESEFQELQVRAACSGTTLKEFLSSEGVKYSTYNYWRKKIKAEEASQPIVLKTDDIHPPKTGISVHFSCSLS